MVLKYLDGSFFHFVTIDALSNGQADGQTDKQTDASLVASLRWHSMQRCKKSSIAVPSDGRMEYVCE